MNPIMQVLTYFVHTMYFKTIIIINKIKHNYCK